MLKIDFFLVLFIFGVKMSRVVGQKSMSSRLRSATDA